MKFTIVLMSLISLIGLNSTAETYEYTLSGMTCSGCKKMVKSAVCSVPGLKTCDVEIGSMKLTADDGKVLDQNAILKALDQLNEKHKSVYKISSSTKVSESTSQTKTK